MWQHYAIVLYSSSEIRRQLEENIQNIAENLKFLLCSTNLVKILRPSSDDKCWNKGIKVKVGVHSWGQCKNAHLHSYVLLTTVTLTLWQCVQCVRLQIQINSDFSDVDSSTLALCVKQTKPWGSTSADKLISPRMNCCSALLHVDILQQTLRYFGMHY